MKSTATHRIWNKGNPPHAGWWNATTEPKPRAMDFTDFWRFWDGAVWYQRCLPEDNVKSLGPERNPVHCWTDYWPEDARVPRIDPARGCVFWNNAWWVLRDGAPEHGTFQVPFTDKAGWLRWAEQRNALLPSKPVEIQGRRHDAVWFDEAAEFTPQVFKGMAHLYTPAKIGRTRMVDGNELTKLAGQAGVIAHEAKVLADRLNEMIRTAS